MKIIVKNCNDNIVEYNFKNEINFLYQMDTIGYENSIPMLDDEVLQVSFIDKELKENIKNVDDLYNLLWKNVLEKRYKNN